MISTWQLGLATAPGTTASRIIFAFTQSYSRHAEHPGDYGHPLRAYASFLLHAITSLQYSIVIFTETNCRGRHVKPLSFAGDETLRGTPRQAAIDPDIIPLAPTAQRTGKPLNAKPPARHMPYGRYIPHQSARLRGEAGQNAAKTALYPPFALGASADYSAAARGLGVV